MQFVDFLICKSGITHVEGLNTISDDDAESDGEFDEDQLLTMLRQQRSQYEQQLRLVVLATANLNGVMGLCKIFIM